MESYRYRRRESIDLKRPPNTTIKEMPKMNSFRQLVAKQNIPKPSASILRSFTDLPNITHSLTLLKSKIRKRNGLDSAQKQLNLLGKITVKTKKIVREQSPEDIFRSRYMIEETLSQSEHSSVYKAKQIADQAPVIIKMITPPEKADRELQMLNSLANKKFSTYKTDFLHNNHRCIVLDYCQYNPQAMNNTKKVAYSLIKAIAKIHSSGIIHSNLSFENILFKNSSLRLIGFSQSFTLCNKRIPNQFHRYRAPELILDCPYNTGIDIWSYGCILAEMLLGKPLFEGSDDQELLISMMKVLGRPPMKFIRQAAKLHMHFEETEDGLLIPKTGQKISYSSKLHCIDKFKQCPLTLGLLKLCFEWNPVHRINAEQAIRHPYFSSRRSVSRKVTQVRRYTKQYTIGPVNKCL